MLLRAPRSTRIISTVPLPGLRSPTRSARPSRLGGRVRVDRVGLALEATGLAVGPVDLGHPVGRMSVGARPDRPIRLVVAPSPATTHVPAPDTPPSCAEVSDGVDVELTAAEIVITARHRLAGHEARRRTAE